MKRENSSRIKSQGTAEHLFSLTPAAQSPSPTAHSPSSSRTTESPAPPHPASAYPPSSASQLPSRAAHPPKAASPPAWYLMPSHQSPEKSSVRPDRETGESPDCPFL